MNVCKICLVNDPKNDLAKLKFTENVDQSGEYMLLFCLGIQVIQDSAQSTKLCKKCSIKLAEFHEFKSLALKNEAILSSLGLQKYIENDIKSEVLSQASEDNEFDEPLVDYSELQKGNLLEEIPPQIPIECNMSHLETKNNQAYEVPLEQGLKAEHSDNEPLSKKKNSRQGGPIKKERFRKKTPASCNLCGKQFVSKYNLETHLETHKPVEERKTFECAHCSKIIITKHGLETHIIRKHPNNVSASVLSSIKKCRKYHCDLCPKRYFYVKNLQEHISAAHARCKPQCPICQKRIAETYLEIHIKTKHQSETLPYKCEVCDWKFAQRTLLRRHASVHTGVKPFSCDICDAKFRLKYSVGLHKAQVHDKSKNHVCHICSKRYFSGSLLQRHIRQHNEPADARPKGIGTEVEKKVVCPDCGKPLSSKYSLKHHRLLHQGQKYPCKVCGQIFSTRSYVHVHMKTHLQERKHRCKYCDSTFVRSSGRRRHELEIHMNEGKKKPPRKYNRNKRIRKKKEKMSPNLPTVVVSLPGHLTDFGRD